MGGQVALQVGHVLGPVVAHVALQGLLHASIDLSNLTVVGLYTRNGFVTTVRLLY